MVYVKLSWNTHIEVNTYARWPANIHSSTMKLLQHHTGLSVLKTFCNYCIKILQLK